MVSVPHALAGPRADTSTGAPASDSAAGLPHLLALLQGDAGARIGALVQAGLAHRARLVAEWEARCAASPGAHGAVSERVFVETYLPVLREAVESVARGDLAAFVALARRLGVRLARDGVPFGAFVAHVRLLRESCEAAVVRDDEEREELQNLAGGLITCLVGAAAETYHAGGPAAVRVPAAPAANEEFHGMVGRSAAMQRVFAHIVRLATTDTPVLLLGETGTGKELAARAVHDAGARRERPFVAVNCAALPRELVESELFGHRRGAFTGAVSDCPGLVRAASGGTLFLDEITEMPPELQAKLLRVVQERRVRPVGATLEAAVDVRIVASSNRDPEQALRSGTLRADLYYRLAASRVVLPPLRARLDDVPPLVQLRLRQLNAQLVGAGARRREATPDALSLLATSSWPGNVRELFNVVDDVFLMCEERIDADVIALVRPSAGDQPGRPDEACTFAQHERALIEATLARTGGNKVRAARRLGISRKKLYARLARYGLVSLALAALHPPPLV